MPRPKMDTTTNAAKPPTRAAQYVRMSTDMQRYSIANQSARILDYAHRNNIEIVRTYTDEAKSGLSIRWRSGLKSLIKDVESGNIDYELVLVYDVSRWGRFQDSDESGHYEFLCRRAGVHVIYCAEQFVNDTSPMSSISKNIRRAMAAEYSRDLSVKVSAGQIRLIHEGFHQGGEAGYGLRRALVDQSRAVKGTLNRGEQKYLKTDHIILVPGPQHEIDLVIQLFHWLVEDNLSLMEMVRRVDALGIKSQQGNPWNRQTILRILTNEKYIGHSVFNKTTQKLSIRSVKNPPELWVRRDSAFTPIVPFELFQRAQECIKSKTRNLTNAVLLAKLRGLLAQRGTLSALIIDETFGMPASRVYMNRFGTLVNAYKLVGFQPDHHSRYSNVRKDLRRLNTELVENIQGQLSEVNGDLTQDSATNLMTLGGETTLMPMFSPCRRYQSGCLFWRLYFDVKCGADLYLIARLKPDCHDILDYFLLPRMVFQHPFLRLTVRNPADIDAYRFDDLSVFRSLGARTPVKGLM